MSSAVAPGLRVVLRTPAVSHPTEDTRAQLRVVSERSEIGHRLVGVTTLLGVTALMVMLGLALFHNMLARGQYELSSLDAEVQVERNNLLDRRFQLESLSAPGEVELVARGALGLEAPVDPIDVVVSADVIRLVSSADDAVLNDRGEGWITLKTLLSDP